MDVNMLDTMALTTLANQTVPTAGNSTSPGIGALGTGAALMQLLYTLMQTVQRNPPAAPPATTTSVESVPTPVSPVPENPVPVMPVVEPQPIPVVAVEEKKYDEPELMGEMECESTPVHMRFREPQPAPPAPRVREEVFNQGTMQIYQSVGRKRARVSDDDDDVALYNKRPGGGNFHSFRRQRMGADECADSVAPEGEFDLPKSKKLSSADCEARIADKAERFGVNLARQSIAARRTKWAKTNALYTAKCDEIADLEQQVKEAEQIEKLHIWTERMRRMIDKSLD